MLTLCCYLQEIPFVIFLWIILLSFNVANSTLTMFSFGRCLDSNLRKAPLPPGFRSRAMLRVGASQRGAPSSQFSSWSSWEIKPLAGTHHGSFQNGKIHGTTTGLGVLAAPTETAVAQQTPCERDAKHEGARGAEERCGRFACVCGGSYLNFLLCRLWAMLTKQIGNSFRTVFHPALCSLKISMK